MHSYYYRQLQDAVRAVARDLNISRDELTDMVNTAHPEASLHPGNLGHLLTDRPSTVVNVLGLVALLARLGQDEVLAAMARHAGYSLERVADVSTTDLLRAAGGYARDVAETELEIAKGMEEGMTDERLAQIEREGREDDSAKRTLLEAARQANRDWNATGGAVRTGRRV
jgi:hypothetical protein